jgi:hypothetical protein
MPRKMLLVLAALVMMVGLGASACGSSADTVSKNLSTEADEFKVERKIVGVNTETDTVLFEITGLCSITRDGDLVVICREGPDEYKKHYLGLSAQTTFISTQLRTLDVSRYHTTIVWRPTSIIPDVDLSVAEQ